VDNRWKKRYDQAATPYERLMKSGKLSPKQRMALREEHRRPNPLDLAEAIERVLREVFGEQMIEELDPAARKTGEHPAAPQACFVWCYELLRNDREPIRKVGSDIPPYLRVLPVSNDIYIPDKRGECENRK